MGLWDSHGPQFTVPALFLIPECDHSTPDMVAGFQDSYLVFREAAVIPRVMLSLLPPSTPTPTGHRLYSGIPGRRSLNVQDNQTGQRGVSSQRVLSNVSEAEELQGYRGPNASWSLLVSIAFLYFYFQKSTSYS